LLDEKPREAQNYWVGVVETTPRESAHRESDIGTSKQNTTARFTSASDRSRFAIDRRDGVGDSRTNEVVVQDDENLLVNLRGIFRRGILSPMRPPRLPLAAFSIPRSVSVAGVRTYARADSAVARFRH
jgi:hypothetical protein